MIGRPVSIALALALVAVVAAGCASAGGADEVDAGAGGDVVDAGASAPDGPPGPTIDAATPPDAPAPDAPEPCTGGDATVVDPATGHCYRLYVAGQNWGAARTLCDAFGPDTHLVTIVDAAENALVHQLGGNLRVWLGFTDAVTEMQWLWVTGEPTAYLNWQGPEPNDDGNEDCAELRGDGGGQWNDEGCDTARAYVCERE